jgi:hypothetical protein
VERVSGPAMVRDDDRAWQYAEVACARCGAIVEVAKFSPQHTSVQWDAVALLRCAEFSAAVADGRPSALIATCASLRSSIDAAVRDGRVEVLPP